jgi:putative transposase
MRAPISYPTDLSEGEWEIISDLLPPASKPGCPRSVDIRSVVNAIFHILYAGYDWRMLPHDFPAWQTVY